MRHAYGIVGDDPTGAPHLAARVDDRAVDLRGVPGVPDHVARATTLDPLLALGRHGWDDVHGAVHEHLAHQPPAVPVDRLAVELPVVPGDYVDFYASEHHATNLGRILRPGEEPLPAAWRHLPIGYHGRAGSIVVSGTPITRPVGLVGPGARRPSERLDLELELGFVVGTAVPMGQVVAPDDADDHVFGVVLVNDWSARDIQSFEYRPLGPFAGKSFATSIAGWVTPLAALPRCAGVVQDPPPDPVLRAEGDGALDLELAWSLNGTPIGRAGTRHLWWTFAQMLCHLTANGAGLRRGDLFASGTVSGPDPGQEGSLIEAARAGEQPITLADGSTRTWLEDGDVVELTGCWRSADGGGSLAPVTGTIVPAPEVR
ncbi:fumarylacetoacetate hydrolase family protein [Actinomarinicola tropica]|uniref:fumarylacetoacetate hydrolase family protein n=1 Tax=Actinomarinicola tropica TaxID=2789776 RepID=UPI001E4B96B0|nr:fumarylacetoacetate hydrolase family protein [Actinomarinicola tropica]